VKPTGQNTKTPHTATGLFALSGAFLRAGGTGASRIARGIGASAVILATAAVTFALPATAGAYATLEGPPIYSAAPGLPDNRVYEQVSPANKNGNSAGAALATFDNPGEEHYALAAPDGNSVLFEGTGPMGETATPLTQYFVASKNEGAAGWSTRALTPATQQAATEIGIADPPLWHIDPSADLSHVMFVAKNGNYAMPPNAQCGIGGDGENQMYLAGSDPFVPATWLERPVVEGSIENCASAGRSGIPDGGTPDFSTVYFTYSGTLLAEDASRAPHTQADASELTEAWGFYEDREGVMREAGILPNGTLDPFGAVPAASDHGRNIVGNQVSADGSRAFFVSPDPASCTSAGGKNNCAVDPPELYVRENGEKTLLVSQDTLLSTAGGLPAAAPGGVLQMPNPTSQTARAEFGPFSSSYVFASPDGSQAFFQSENALTQPAEKASPGTEPKMYDFDVDTGVLTYLPGVAGQIVATDTSGSAFTFVRPESGGQSAELDLWLAGPGGGSVTPITQFPGSPASGLKRGEYVSEAQMSGDGSVVVFATAAPIAGFNNGGTHLNARGASTPGSSIQIYRYDASANKLGCVSCPPRGVTPSSNASMSSLRSAEEIQEEGTKFSIPGMVGGRGVSIDGSRIFFESSDPLVSRDTNTASTIYSNRYLGFLKQGGDVYEWENGVVYLISTGKSSVDSFLLDSSENGDDVFFATAEGLVPGDTDGAYDVYDARVPQPGDNPPPAAVPCEGSVCQGPPNVPAPLTPPASTTFAGLGNPTPETTPGGRESNPKTTKKTVKCAKGKKLSHGKCVKVKSKKKKAKRASNDRRAKS
jgi:hypothetical protein